jgi:hypothetical protein
MTKTKKRRNAVSVGDALMTAVGTPGRVAPNPGKGSFARCVQDVSRRGGVDDPAAVCAASKIRAGEDLRRPGVTARRTNPRNPADLAAEAFEAFHGYPPDENIVFESMEHEHTVFAGIGDLEELVIVPEGERKGIRLHSFGGAQLTCNEQALAEDSEIAQLYIVGGDQGLDMKTLRQFGIDPSNLHEQEVLGKCVDITYFTIKTHLGRDGGEADYMHKFGEESAKRHMRILVSPTATYHVVNKIIGLWGGKYTIEPEGIRN